VVEKLDFKSWWDMQYLMSDRLPSIYRSATIYHIIMNEGHMMDIAFNKERERASASSLQPSPIPSIDLKIR
jgi:hypothetical protein